MHRACQAACTDPRLIAFPWAWSFRSKNLNLHGYRGDCAARGSCTMSLINQSTAKASRPFDWNFIFLRLHSIKHTHSHFYKYVYANLLLWASLKTPANHTPMNTCTRILSLWASLKTEAANPRDWRSHHRHLTVNGNIAYHRMHNAVKS